MVGEGNREPLAYLGIRSRNPPKLVFQDRAPTTADYKNFVIGDEWWDSSSSDWYKLVNLSGTTATWRKIGGTSAATETFTTDDANTTGPDGANNIILTGTGPITTASTPASNTLTIESSAVNTFDTDDANTTGADSSNNIVLTGTGPITTASTPGTNTLTIESSAVNTFTTDDANVTGADASNNITFAGGPGIETTSTPGSNLVTISAIGSGFTWSTVSGTSANLVSDNGYFADNVALVTFTLPASADVGDVYWVVGIGAGGWSIAQNAGQQIIYGNTATTVGVGGSLSSSHKNDAVMLICAVANTTFIVPGISEGTLNVV